MNKTFFTGKYVWITGASSGIGRALMREFLNSGANLIVSSSNEGRLNEIMEELKSSTSDCHGVLLDLSNPGSITSAVETIKQKIGRVNILINNGGISQRSFVEETPLEIDRKIMEINYFGNIGLTKAVLPMMVEEGNGHVVAISSITGKFGFPLRSAYAASKHALHGFYDSARAELKSKNIKVTVISPGRVKTNISINAITKDGTSHGKMDEGQAKGISAEKCAKKILHAIRTYKKEDVIGGKEIIMVYIRRYLPSLFYKLASRVKPT
jgi:short-subunit dehydrogenase